MAKLLNTQILGNLEIYSTASGDNFLTPEIKINKDTKEGINYENSELEEDLQLTCVKVEDTQISLISTNGGINITGNTNINGSFLSHDSGFVTNVSITDTGNTIDTFSGQGILQINPTNISTSTKGRIIKPIRTGWQTKKTAEGNILSQTIEIPDGGLTLGEIRTGRLAVDWDLTAENERGILIDADDIDYNTLSMYGNFNLLNGDIKLGTDETKTYKISYNGSASLNYITVDSENIYVKSTLDNVSYKVLHQGNLGYTTNNTNRNYQVQKDSSENLFVNVPWENQKVKINGTTFEDDAEVEFKAGGELDISAYNTPDNKYIKYSYTHPSYTATTGVPSKNETPGFGESFNVNQISSDAKGHVTGNTPRSVTIPSTFSNGNSTAGLIKTSSTVTSNTGYIACPVIKGVPYYANTAHTHTVGKGLKMTPADDAGGISGNVEYKPSLKNTTNSKTSSTYERGGNNKFYALQLDKDDYLAVYVPWKNQTVKVSDGESGYKTFDEDDCVEFKADGDLSISADNTSNTKFIKYSYTHPNSYTPAEGHPNEDLINDKTPSFGGTFKVNQISSDEKGHVTGNTERTIKIPDILSDGSGTAGLIKTNSTVTESDGYTACPVINGVPYYKNINDILNDWASRTFFTAAY